MTTGDASAAAGPRIVVLSGGVGGARFTRGLLHHAASAWPDGTGGTTAQVTVVANTGDDLWLHGVRVCPDLDTLLYTLGGAVHEEQGWGRRGETSRVSSDLAAYGVGWDWFTLGDLDLATHLARTQWLREGLTLSQVTTRLAERWRPGVRLLPMCDEPCETHVETTDGTLLHFEEWWVRHRAAVPVRRFVQAGVAAARPAPGVVEALLAADVVVLPPSNPVVSVGTILGVPGLRDAVLATTAPVVGVSPIVGGAPVRGMADACLAALGVATSAEAVARHYGLRSAGGVLDGWLVDTADAATADRLAADGWRSRATDTLMRDVPGAGRVAASALALASW